EQYQFEVSATQIADLAGLDSVANAYRDLKKSADKLYERSVIINDPDPENPQVTERKTRWISSIDYIPGEGKLVLNFSAGIIPYLSRLSKEFTQYKLRHVARFESIYSIRLYELLVQWSSVGEREIEVEWLKKQFQVENKYKRLSDLKRRVIDPAVVEINKHSNLWVKYGQRKSGRTVTHFQFQFGLKDQPKLRKHLSEEEIKQAAKPGETRAAVIARLTGTKVDDFAKPGETFDQALARKRALQDVNSTLSHLKY
uniref:replication initiation protein n=1 Tax=Thiolapillus sp. TaxID=2017437 RepID=UPI003AF8CF1E